MKRNLLVMTLVLFGSLTATAAEQAKDVKTFPAAGLSGITIGSGAGFFSVEGTGADSIEVEQLPGNAVAFDVAMKASGKNFELKVYPKSGHKAVHTGFRIKVPAGFAVNANMGTGIIKVAAISGPVNIENTAGAISLDNVSGDLKIKTITGSIKGNAKSPKMEISGTTGLVQLGGLAGSLVMNTTTSPIDLKWESMPENGKIDITSSAGTVYVGLPSSAKIKTDLNVEGPIYNDFISSEAGLPVAIQVGGGSITIRKAKR
jgi:DUF4097 and DUF4098 domain-containing protein YvlB